jgi:hypothetical protein
MSQFRIATLSAAVPLSVLAVLTIAASFGPGEQRLLVNGTLAAFGLSVLSLIGFAIVRRTSVVAGIFAGLAIAVRIAVVAFGLSCFVALGRM